MQGHDGLQKGIMSINPFDERILVKSICDHKQSEPYFVLQSLSCFEDKLPNGEHLNKSIIRQINDIIGDPVVVIDTILK